MHVKTFWKFSHVSFYKECSHCIILSTQLLVTMQVLTKYKLTCKFEQVDSKDLRMNALHSTFLSLLLTSFHNINLQVSSLRFGWLLSKIIDSFLTYLKKPLNQQPGLYLIPKETVKRHGEVQGIFPIQLLPNKHPKYPLLRNKLFT